MDANKRTRLFSTIGIVIILGALAFAGFRTFGALGSRVGSWFDAEPAREFHSVDTDAGSGRTVGVDLPSDLRDFDRIVAQGGWKVTIRPGDFDVTVTVDERSADDVKVYRRGDTLSLAVASGLRTVTGTMEAEITVPALRRLEIDGGAEVRIQDLDVRRLEIDVDGAASIRGIDVRLEELHVDVDGAANIDFSASSVVNAEVDMDGASNFSVTMSGGRLTGVLSGVGNITYGGEVREESVRVEGLGRVRER